MRTRQGTRSSEAAITAKPKRALADYAKRYAAERARQQRRYCDAFALWLRCRMKMCRRLRACHGDPNHCLKRALKSVPHAMQWQTRQKILRKTPANIGKPERTARQCMPRDFYESRS